MAAALSPWCAPRLIAEAPRPVVSSLVRSELGGVPLSVARHSLRRVREEVEVLYRAQGNDPRPHAPQVESLAVQIAALYVDEGRSRDEIGTLIEAGQVRP